MIPKSQPPFGIGAVIKAILSFYDVADIEQVESAYAHVYGFPNAILLPSARSGISWVLKASIKQGTKVVCPAFTCKEVWDAIVRAGGRLNLVDIGKNTFLMDETDLSLVQTGNYAVVFCEIYGYTYDLAKISKSAPSAPILRIVDMAMTVPVVQLFERLGDKDFAVISFGSGKCMYAGWGGMGFTRDNLLARKVRAIRDSSMNHCDFSLLIRRSVKMLAFNLLHYPVAFRFFHKINQLKRHNMSHLACSVDKSRIFSATQPPTSKEWFLPTTYIDRYLMLHNLKCSEQYCEHRKALASRYHKNMETIHGVIPPNVSSYALSHYTIRVKSKVRQLIKRRLESSGINVGTLFFFPVNFSKTRYPNASQVASEVLNLPLNIGLTTSDVDLICDRLVHAVDLG